ncbi:MAG: diguanylate cyclase domain-containing protein [Gammaproteobacteria bacterium]
MIRLRSLRQAACLATALLAGGFALAVVIGWHVHALSLIQLRPHHAPAQFNAALALLACAMGLAGQCLGRARLAALAGGAGAVLAAATLAEYFLPYSVRLDDFFLNPYLNVQTSTPGRMAPNAALCLILAGAALALQRLRSALAATLAGVGALAAACIATLAAIGYAIDVEMAYGWHAATRLDLPSALALALLAAAILWQCAAQWSAHRALRWAWYPLLVGAVMVTLTAAIWLSLLNAERLQLRATASEDLQRLCIRVADAIAADLRALEQLRQRQDRRAPVEDEWRQDAGAIVRGATVLAAIEAVDGARQVRWAAPAHAMPAQRDLGLDLDQLAAMEAARFGRATVLTHVIDLAQGGEGFIAFVPLAPDAAQDAGAGFVAGVFDVRPLLADFADRGEAGRRYAMQLFDGERKFHSRDDDALPEAALVQEGSIRVHNLHWRVRIWPTAAEVARASSWLPWAVLSAGLAVSLLLSAITLLIQLAGARARKLRVEVGERRKAEQENAMLLSELEVVFANVSVGIALVKDGRTLRCNAQYARLLGSAPEQLVGAPVASAHPSRIIGEQQGDAMQAAFARGDTFATELELTRPDGATFWAACFGKALDKADSARGAVWVVEEISERKMAEERLLHQAQHDGLTGLANRVKFASRLDQAIARAARSSHTMAVCYIDLDKFKYVNDTFGHDAGDHLLLAVSKRLTGSVRETDTVARLGGDEFALVLAGPVDGRIVAAVLDRIIHALQEELEFGGHTFAVSGSIGMAMYPAHGPDAQTLLKHADEAMYRAKQAGRNNWKAWAPDVAEPVDNAA